MQLPSPLGPSPDLPDPPAQPLPVAIPFFQLPNVNVAAGTTTFAGPAAAGFSTPESTRLCTSSVPFSVSRLRVIISTAQPAAQNLTINVRRNTVNIGLQLVILASAVIGIYEAVISPPVAFGVGDSPTLQLVQDAGASASATIASWQLS